MDKRKKSQNKITISGMKCIETADRSIALDSLKAVSIIAVVLYHMGIFSAGYLGVDVFLVIAGYLTAKSIMKSIDKQEFSYALFLIKRFTRLMPIVLLATTLCFAIGYFVMLPDDFENLSETIVATNLFANNILQCITTRNYWDVVNNYKPLMHTWYLGVLMQSYFVVPVIFMIAKKAGRDGYKKFVFGISLTLMLVSLVIYMLPCFSTAEKFYYLPFRIFEVLAGVILACTVGNNHMYGIQIIRGGYKLLVFSFIGRCSLSIYIWHQIFLAFIRYAVKTDLGFADNLIYLLLIGIVSALSYRFIEKGYISRKEKKSSSYMKGICLGCLFIAINIASLVVYMRAGVVRDVPELDIYAGHASRGMHAEYNSRIREYDKDFGENNLTHILIVGNSFGRDWANILLESDLAKNIEISYIEGKGERFSDEQLSRCKKADRIFWAASGFEMENLPNRLREYYEEGKLYIVGTKNFGDSNGIAYNQKKNEHYYDFQVLLRAEYVEKNERMKKEYGEQYIDLIEPVRDKDGMISIYTPDHKFISQDCRHLTKAGAVFYAENLELEEILHVL